MKKALLILTLILSIQVFSQSPSGYWYGNANVKLNNSYNNYMVELIIEQEGNNVKGVLNYFFKNTYRSFPIRRSEERRVGKSVDLGGRRIIKKKKNKI